MISHLGKGSDRVSGFEHCHRSRVLKIQAQVHTGCPLHLEYPRLMLKHLFLCWCSYKVQITMLQAVKGSARIDWKLRVWVFVL